MADYTPQIDAQIANLLRTRGSVSPDMISGIAEDEARAFLRHYVAVNPDEDVFMDGDVLLPSKAGLGGGQGAQPLGGGGYPGVPPTGYTVPPPTGYTAPPSDGYGVPSPYGAATPLSPAAAYAPPTHGKAPGWLWVLPVVFGIMGGVLAWALAKDKDPKAARGMLVLGFALVGVSVLAGFGLGFMDLSASTPTDTSWPATGSVTFYYFGSPG